MNNNSIKKTLKEGLSKFQITDLKSIKGGYWVHAGSSMDGTCSVDVYQEVSDSGRWTGCSKECRDMN